MIKKISSGGAAIAATTGNVATMECTTAKWKCTTNSTAAADVIVPTDNYFDGYDKGDQCGHAKGCPHQNLSSDGTDGRTNSKSAADYQSDRNDNNNNLSFNNA